MIAGPDRCSRPASALLLAMANLFYRDVKYLFEVVITVWMFATSVLYPVEPGAAGAGVRAPRSIR